MPTFVTTPRRVVRRRPLYIGLASGLAVALASAIVARSASAIAEDRQRAIACGMNDFAPKPIELNGLRAVLEKWIPGFVPTFVEKKPSPVTASRG